MAAERTPSRRKQCIFHRTFLRLPFGRCEKRSRSGSSYDIHQVEATKPTAEKWSTKESSVTALGLHQPHPGENTDPDGGSRAGVREENVVLEPVLVNGHQSNPGAAPQNSIDHQNMDSLEVSLEDLGQQEVDSAYSSVSQIEQECLHHMVSPPSPSVSSMDTDVGVDPETGERAME